MELSPAVLSTYHSITLFLYETIGLCSDHAGFELKEYVRGWLEVKGWPYKDYGTYSAESCDYPDFAHQLAQAVEAGEVIRELPSAVAETAST